MSQTAVEQIMGKLLLDPGFRQMMASDMPQALTGFDLTDSEREAFQHMDLQDFNHTVTGLDQRVSKGIQLN
jgi:hypothetical protein